VGKPLADYGGAHPSLIFRKEKYLSVTLAEKYAAEDFKNVMGDSTRPHPFTPLIHISGSAPGVIRSCPPIFSSKILGL